jgi:hypothetical protein
MHYQSTFLYIVGTYFYTLLLAAGDVASLLAEDLLTSGHQRRSPASPTQPSHVGSGSAPLATGLHLSPTGAGSAANIAGTAAPGCSASSTDSTPAARHDR